LVLACCCGYRLPEPTRLAHMLASGNLRRCGTPKESRSAMVGTPNKRMMR
jgi:hypothetical protein